MAVTDTKTRQVDTEHGEGLFLRRETLEWIERRAHLSEDVLVAEFPEYRDWKYGRSPITHDQIQELADFTYEPYTYFLLKPHYYEKFITDFRTLRGHGTVRDWFDLEPSIRQRVAKSTLQQDWLREYRMEEGFSKVGWLGSCVWAKASPVDAARMLRELLAIDFKNIRFSSEYVAALVTAAENSGVLVQSGNVVTRRSLRPLDLGAFNCFQLLDDFAPLVFLHSDTSDEAQVFVLVYALAHLLAGEAGVGLAKVEDVFGMEGVELWCSQVALEFLVPEGELFQYFRDKNGSDINVVKFANEYQVSPIIVLIRMKQSGLVSSNNYQLMFDRYLRGYYDNEKENGRYFHQEKHVREIGFPFARAVAKDLYDGKIDIVSASEEFDRPYSEIHRLYYRFR